MDGRWWLALLLAIGLLAVLPPASAQTQAEPAAPAAADASSYAGLADILEDDAARTRLVEQLRALANGAPPAAVTDGATLAPAATGAPAPPPAQAPPADPAAVAVPTDNSVASRLADSAQSFVGNLAGDAQAAVSSLRDLFTGGTDPARRVVDWPAVLGQLGVVILATVAGFIVLRMLATGIFRRLDQWVVRQGSATPTDPPRRHRLAAFGSRLAVFYTRAIAMVLALVVDAAVILLAGAIGYAMSVFWGATSTMGTFDALFVNAFVAVELAKCLVRVVFATRFEHLRLLPMPDDVARYWNAWLANLITVAGYGLLVVVPIVTVVLAPAIGQLFGLIIMLGVYIYAVTVIWRNRVVLRDRLIRRAQLSSTAFFGTLLRMLARTWHILAIAYFTILLIASQVDPAGALPFMAAATGQTLLAVAIGMLLSALLTALLARRIRVGEDIQRRLPMLEARLNAYVPAVLKGVRLLILVVVALVVLDAWHVFNLSAWIASESGSAAIGTLVRIGIILGIAMVAWTVVASIIEHRLNIPAEGDVTGAPSAREKTLLSLFRNASLIVIVTMTVLVLLSQIGIDIGPLIAGAGVVGLAIGFGAQELVKDVITGVFIQIENGMNQNDVVEVAGIFGTVEKMTIRSVYIRTLDGGYHMIPFSQVGVVANHMRDFSYHWGEYTVAYRENVDDVAHHLRQAYAELQQDEVLAKELLEDITIAGVTKLDERGFTIRVLIKTTPGMQWAVQRAYNRLVKKHFNAANIELPYPHTVVYFGQDKQGNAPAANVHTIDEREIFANDSAPANGAMFRPLQVDRGHNPADVLGNELETVYDDDGKRKEPPAPQPERT